MSVGEGWCGWLHTPVCSYRFRALSNVFDSFDHELLIKSYAYGFDKHSSFLFICI